MKSIAAALLCLGVGLTPVFSQGSGEPGPRPRREEAGPRMMDHMVRALNLTPEQKTKWDGIVAKHKPAREAKHKAALDAGKAYQEAMRKPETKAEDLKTLHRAAADAKFDVLMEHRAQRQELRDILTPEQREKAAFILGRMERGMRGPRDGHGEGGMR